LKAVILAAGEGTRLQPFTATRPKHLLPIANKPLLEHLLRAIRETGITDIGIVIGYRAQMIKDYFKTGENWGITITYFTQQSPSGTAHALNEAKKFVNEDYFLLSYGDLYVHPSEITSLLDHHEKTGLASIAVVPVNDPKQFGIITLKNGYVHEIVEKPEQADHDGNLANAGLYILPKAIFSEISRTPTSPRKELELTDTLQLLVHDGTLISTNRVNPENWLDLGRPWNFLEANKRALINNPLKLEGTIEKGVTIDGDVGIETGARIRSGTYLEGPLIIGRHSDIGPNVYIRPHTSIGQGVRVGNACEVKASIILNHTHIGHLSYIGDSIIGENCNIGAGTIVANLRFDNNTVKVRVRNSQVDTGRRKLGVMMGDDVQTGISVNIMPGIKIGSKTWVGPNTTVYRDTEAGSFLIQEQRLRSLKSRKKPLRNQ
jgi:bifunctional UDP-N-acetylglucosamine pyrophosphorylase/glucosamine-1-phosphate N-acetyltransferase